MLPLNSEDISVHHDTERLSLTLDYIAYALFPALVLNLNFKNGETL